ncbi:MAG: Crp/Fnr family transcriptional regulator [Sphingomonas bacterium]|uniref:Crp/Fnr family transcriptional regulator n=1 Tax=Sphingomonas bacterium TaxID=1895847 RepID=UPI0026021E6A|nr:Crp/Fnr family transcriptional regulator [Sphingomonas bacterium]MDB5705981.1 Crp/Fnr family transcriptional regulator [Sphingomonas bacterium]
MSSDDPILLKIVRKLESRARLDPGDRAAIMALPYAHRTYEAPAYVLREGEPPRKQCNFVLSGLAFRQKLAATGARQIVSIHMAGDFLDVQHLFLNRADHSVQALSRLETAEIDRVALQDLVLRHPAIGRAMWVDTLIDASIFREWILNVGRRDAKARVAHLLCEVSIRMEAAGLTDGTGYELPLTQEQLGDAVGLTSVHVNRTLRVLAEQGLIRRDRRHVRFDDLKSLRAAADFSALYLHLDQELPAEG